jgi:hypothetical protein
LDTGHPFAGGTHFKGDAKGLVEAELYPVEKCSRGSALDMLALITKIAVVLSPVPAIVPTFGAFKAVMPL